jgi:hypothetical protein
MKYFEMIEAFDEAQEILDNADITANRTAHLLIGRLRRVEAYNLKKLKKELKQFNAATGEWMN